MTLFFKKYQIVNKYNQYREVGKVLNSKIFECFIDKTVLLQCGKLLGLVKRDTFIIDREIETIAMMDFTLNEYQINGKSAVKLYEDNLLMNNLTENLIINALLKSYTSLFKVIDTATNKYSLILEDVLNRGSDPIKVLDKGLSLTASAGLLIFLRVIPFDDFNMNGGFGFAFNGDLEEYLLKQFKYLVKQIKSPNDSIKRFISFFKLYRRHGIEMGFI